MKPEISALLNEGRVIEPSPEWRERARITDPRVYERAAADPQAFWAALAAELEWTEPWINVLDWQSPYARWFVGGRLNVSVNCLDRHVRTARRNKAALIWEGEPGDRRTLTYFDLHRQVNQFANVLHGLGVARGDRVALYMPMVPELAIAMLACARIGAVHSVVFGGFSAEALRDRINDAKASVLVTADGGYRRGQIVPLKQMADEALGDTPSIRHVVIVKRQEGDAFPVHVQEGRDHWFRLCRTRRRSRAEPRTETPHPLPPRHDRNRRHRAPTAGYSSARTQPRGGCSTSRTKTCTGARPTSAG
jgi:acetyl-CoA synthetase